MIIFAGVHFMAETAAILSPGSECCCPTSRRLLAGGHHHGGRRARSGRREFPDYISVGYVNTTAEVKAELDYCCTSGNVLDVIDAIPATRGSSSFPISSWART